jgi:hypothetical protein
MKLLLPLLAAFQLYTVQAQQVDEEKLSEKHQIESQIRKRYYLDASNINFAILPKDTLSGFFGIYSPWCDSLKLDYYNILRKTEKNSLSPDSLIARIMNHELGHCHVDEIQERLGLKSVMENKYSRDLLEEYLKLLNTNNQSMIDTTFQKFLNTKNKDLTTILLDRMVNEGTALYYENPSIKPLHTSWPTSVNDIKAYNQYYMYIYSTGWNLMHPIISMYGDKGIEHVLKNMPRKEDFSDLQRYQKKILKELAK